MSWRHARPAKGCGLISGIGITRILQKRIVIRIGSTGRIVTIIPSVKSWTGCEVGQIGKALERYAVNRQRVCAAVLRRPRTKISSQDAYVGRAGNGNGRLPGYRSEERRVG